MKVAYKRKIPSVLGGKLKAIVPISVPYEESMFQESSQNGDTFLRTMRLISEDDRIVEVTILITDTLQVHNLKAIHSLNQEEAETEAERLGKLWYKSNIEANKSFFDDLGKNITIQFWNDYIKNDNFVEIHQKVKELYSKEKPNGFYQKTRSLAGTFTNKTLERLEKQQNKVFLKENIIDGSVDLLLEESAVRIILGSYFDLEFYPDELDAVMSAACEKYSKNKPYRVTLNIKKEQEIQTKEIKTANSSPKDGFFFEKSYSYHSSTSTGSMNTIIEPQNQQLSPFFGAIWYSTMLAVKDNDDPLIQTEFLTKYNQFLNGFVSETKKNTENGFKKPNAAIILNNHVSKEKDETEDEERYRKNKF